MKLTGTIVGLLLISLLGSATRAAESRLTGPEILQDIVGNTVAWEDEGGCSVEYYRPDGVVIGQRNNASFTAHWWVRGSLMCFKYDFDPDKVCWRVATEQNIVYWLPPDGEGSRLKTTLFSGQSPSSCVSPGA